MTRYRRSPDARRGAGPYVAPVWRSFASAASTVSMFVTAGTILVKQRGTKLHPGTNVRRASDDTLFTVINGVVKFEYKDKTRQRVSVYPKPEGTPQA